MNNSLSQPMPARALQRALQHSSRKPHQVPMGVSCCWNQKPVTVGNTVAGYGLLCLNPSPGCR